jgi:hypothetical protein
MTETAKATNDKTAPEKKPEPKRVVITDKSAYAPIVDARPLSRLHFLHRKVPAPPWVARVFVLANGRLVDFAWDRQPTAGELLWGGFRTCYEVDMSLRRLRLAITLPSAGDAFAFRAEVDVQWRVTDPKRVVAAGVTDVRKVLEPLLLDGLRQATRSTQAFDVEVAEKAANAQFGPDWLAADHGLWTKVLVRLRMDQQKEESVRLEAEVEAYKTLIAGGDLNQFALQLAKNPEQVEAVVRLLVQDRDIHRKQVYDFISQLLESDALDRWQIEDQVRVTLQWMGVSINRVLTGIDDGRPFPFADPARPAGASVRTNGGDGSR